MLLTQIMLGIMALVLLGLCSYLKWQLMKRNVLLKSAHATEKQLRDNLGQLERQCHLALEDHVTGLPTWPVFEETFNRVMVESERSQMTAGLLLVEISDFPMLAGGLDSKSGHAVLKEAGNRIRLVLRKVDTVSRYKNATFGVMATQLAKAETAAMVAQRILQTLAEPFRVNDHELYIDANIGIAIYPSDGTDLDGLLRAAQSAVGAASESGNHVYRFYQEKNQIVSQRELSIHVDVKRGSIFQELELYYQPVIDSTTKAILSMDTLLTWRHPDLGLIDTQELYYHIEKQRRENDFSEWLFKAAFQQFVQWREFGFCPALISIPVSMRQLEATSFIYHLTQMAQASGFKLEWLLLELKETNTEPSFDVLEKAFNMLSYLGIKLAISYAGVTSFSFSYLRHINVHYIVLEQNFIDDVEHNLRTQAMLKGMKALADNLTCQLVVRGVENQHQAALLSNMGCSLLRGSLFGEPVRDCDVRVKIAPQV